MVSTQKLGRKEVEHMKSHIIQEDLFDFIHIFHNKNCKEIHFSFVVDQLKQFDHRNINLPKSEYDKMSNHDLKE